MKAIYIAAGYATRLYPLTENFPKPLLQIGSSSILGRLIADTDLIPEIDEHIIVSNGKFAQIFRDWASEQSTGKPTRIIDDGTFSNETRLGAVCDLLLAINSLGIQDDILVAAADNILDFSLSGFVDFFHSKGSSIIMCHHEPSLERLQRTGVIELDDNMRVLQMQEKPQVPVSNWAVPPFYIYKKSDMPLILSAIDNGCGFDAPGNLAHFLCERTTMHAWPMPGRRHDIGSLDSLKEAQALFKA